MRVLDLFSGIGGFSLGLERAGMTTVAFCEIDDYCRQVLAKHWPGVPCYGDIRELTAAKLRADGISVDLICGGFPCQDISVAGKGAGLAGERSGLWSEYSRLVGELRPRNVIVENVSALLGRGLGAVLGDLAALGYDAEWHCIPASYVGAPHRRDRVWIVAYARSSVAERADAGTHDKKVCGNDARLAAFGNGEIVSDPIRKRQQGQGKSLDTSNQTAGAIGEAIDVEHGRFRDQWKAEPNVGRVADGVPSRVDRLRSLGNAVVPQIPEIIGRAIMRLS